MLLQRFPELERMRVLDLGGDVRPWLRAPQRPAELVTLNLHPAPPVEPPEWTRHVQGDALDAPDLLAGEDFDLVYSNSLLEHLGGYFPRRRFAEVVRGLSASHWVQTPYRYFPLEPHWMVPGFQFLPVPVRAFLSHRWPKGFVQSTSYQAAVGHVLGVELVGRAEMHHLFPDSVVLAERILGCTKSLIAVRGGTRGGTR